MKMSKNDTQREKKEEPNGKQSKYGGRKIIFKRRHDSDGQTESITR